MTVCGIGGWTGPLPGDPNSAGGLTATQAFGGIEVFWSYPTINASAVAHTILYRGTSAVFAAAVQHRIVTGNYFFDVNSSESPVTYYYWIKIVSVHGTVGDLIGPASATGMPTIAQTIALLSGQIDAGHLSISLASEIGNIGLLGNSITDEVAARIAAHDSLVTYLNDVNGNTVAAITLIESETINRVTAHGNLLTQLDLMAVGFDGAVAGLAEEITLLATPDGALAERVTTVEASLNGDVATAEIGLIAVVGDVIDTTTGLTSAIGAMYTAKVQVNGLVGGFGIYNDGATVEAGFDVDKFWIGKTGATTIKPFIVNGGQVFIDNAVINQLTADKIDTRNLTIKDAAGNIIFSAGANLAAARITPDAGWLNTNVSLAGLGYSGSLIATYGANFGTNITGQITSGNASTFIANAAINSAQIGVITADKINTNGLVVRDLAGNAIFSAGIPLAASYITPSSTWLNSNVSLGGLGFSGDANATYGAIFGTNISGQISPGNVTTFIAQGTIGNVQIGNAAITNAKIGNLAVDTLQIAGNAVTLPSVDYVAAAASFSATESGAVCSATFGSYVNNGANTGIYVHFSGTISDPGTTVTATVRIKRDGVTIASQQATVASGESNGVSLAITDVPATGAHTYTVTVQGSSSLAYISQRSLFCLQVKR